LVVAMIKGVKIMLSSLSKRALGGAQPGTLFHRVNPDTDSDSSWAAQGKAVSRSACDVALASDSEADSSGSAASSGLQGR